MKNSFRKVWKYKWMTEDEMKMNIHKNKMLWYNTRYCIRASYERSWNIRKDLKSKELGKGISQESTGLYSARFVDRFGKRKHKRFKKLQECRAWIADATYVDEHSDISMPSDMLVDQWFDYWIGIKKKTVRSNTVRNYTERYIKNINR